MSSSGEHEPPKRNYRLGERARKAQETRCRIVEAAVALHSTLGPARTTVTQIAERAGVQRHTYYAHFPDERSLFLACSGLAIERDPLPAVDRLRSFPPGRERVRSGLETFYNWYERNSQHAACVLRDAQHHQLTREMVERRMAPTFRQATEILGEGLSERSQALLSVALDFACWQRLKMTCTCTQAAELMSDAVVWVSRP
jgi:AcrR family transcriptional regulator